jgi:hypothetical protein
MVDENLGHGMRAQISPCLRDDAADEFRMMLAIVRDGCVPMDRCRLIGQRKDKICPAAITVLRSRLRQERARLDSETGSGFPLQNASSQDNLRQHIGVA